MYTSCFSLFMCFPHSPSKILRTLLPPPIKIKCTPPAFSLLVCFPPFPEQNPLYAPSPPIKIICTPPASSWSMAAWRAWFQFAPEQMASTPGPPGSWQVSAVFRIRRQSGSESGYKKTGSVAPILPDVHPDPDPDASFHDQDPENIPINVKAGSILNWWGSNDFFLFNSLLKLL